MKGVTEFLTLCVAISTLTFTGVRLGWLVLPSSLDGAIDFQTILSEPDGSDPTDIPQTTDAIGEDGDIPGGDRPGNSQAEEPAGETDQRNIWDAWQSEPDSEG